MRATLKRTLVFVAVGMGGLLLSLPSCSRSPTWSQNEWDSLNGTPPPSPPPNLSEHSQRTRLGLHQVEFREQSIAGVPIEGSFVKSLNSDGKTKWQKSRYLSEKQLPSVSSIELELRNRPAIEKILVQQAALKNCKLQGALEPALRWQRFWQLVFKQSCETPDGRAYEIAVNSLGRLLNHELVGAYFNTNSPSDMTAEVATVFPKGPKLSTLQSIALQVSSLPTFLKSESVEVSSDAGYKLNQLSDFGQITPSDDRFAMVQAYYFSDHALHWVEDHLHFKMSGLRLRTFVGYPQKNNVAFYFNHEVRIGQGDDQSFSNMPLDPSIVIHETMHAVIEDLTHLPFRDQGGSINEALADSLTAVQLDDPLIGQTAYRNAPYQRTLLNSAHLKDLNGSLYHDSLILSGTIWELKQTLDADTALNLVSYLLAHLTPASQMGDVSVQMRNWLNQIGDPQQRASAETILKVRGWL